MFSEITYEELNQMIENPRSEDFDTYFDSMEITESEKEKRKSLAEKLRDYFLPILILLFTMQQYGVEIDWEEIRIRIEIGYKKAIDGVIDLDDYMKRHITNFSYDVVDSTQEHQTDPYYYSIDRSILIAENESNAAFSQQEFSNAIKSGKTKKQWIDVRDKRERETHRKVGRTIKPINEPFMVGNSLMMFARDSETFGAEAKEIVNCRCTTKYF